MQLNFKNLLPHLVIIILFIATSLVYFSPVLQGQKIFQSDIVQYTGMAKQLVDYREINGSETYWTDAAFGGMPTYQLGAKYPHNYIKKLDLTLRFLTTTCRLSFPLFYWDVYTIFSAKGRLQTSIFRRSSFWLFHIFNYYFRRWT